MEYEVRRTGEDTYLIGPKDNSDPTLPIKLGCMGLVAIAVGIAGVAKRSLLCDNDDDCIGTFTILSISLSSAGGLCVLPMVVILGREILGKICNR